MTRSDQGPIRTARDAEAVVGLAGKFRPAQRFCVPVLTNPRLRVTVDTGINTAVKNEDDRNNYQQPSGCGFSVHSPCAVFSGVTSAMAVGLFFVLMRPPAFQFYADDFLSGTLDMTFGEVGCYIILLCYQWNKGSVPNNDDMIRRICRITQAFSLDHIKSKFEVGEDGNLRNTRLEHERKKQDAFREKQAINGAKGGRPINPSLSSGLTQTKAKKSSPSPSPSPSPSTSPSEKIYVEASEVLGYLREKSGRDYRECKSSLGPIVARLNEPGITVEGCKLMIDRQAKLWEGTRFQEFIRPQTLFGKEKFDGYYAARELPINQTDRPARPQHADRNVNTANEGSTNQYGGISGSDELPIGR